MLKFFYLIYYNTLRICVVNEQFSPSHRPQGENVIYVSWHSKTFSSFGYSQGHKIALLTLLDWKNVVFDRLCQLLYFETVPVSSNVRAVIKLKNFLMNGHHVALALDGPAGPAGVIRPGALYLAQRTGKPVVAVNCYYEKSLRLCHRWDRYEIPLPFTKVTMTFSEPIAVRSDDHGETDLKIKEFLGAP